LMAERALILKRADDTYSLTGPAYDYHLLEINTIVLIVLNSLLFLMAVYCVYKFAC